MIQMKTQTVYQMFIDERTFEDSLLNRGKSSITDPLLIPTTSRISVIIRDINKLYINELLVI